MVRIKRAYEDAAGGDGFRVLVDRLWPRGVTRQRAAVDLWARELAPTTSLRTWFAHDPARFSRFAALYHRELKRAAARPVLRDLARRATHGTVTLVYGARDPDHNNAAVLRDEIRRFAAHGGPEGREPWPGGSQPSQARRPVAPGHRSRPAGTRRDRTRHARGAAP